jgi:hypothetical protein
VPPVIPCTTTEPDNVATEVLLLVHTPPGDGSLKLIVEPGHTFVGPVIPDIEPLTVIATPTAQDPTV